MSVNGVETYRVRPFLHSADESRESQRDAVEEYRDVGMDVVGLEQIGFTSQTRCGGPLCARRRVSPGPVQFAHLVVVVEIDDSG